MAAEQLIHLGSDIDDTLVHSGPLTIEEINRKFGTKLTLDHWYQDPFDEAAWTVDQKTSWGWVNDILHSREFIEGVESVEGAAEVLAWLELMEQGRSASTGRPEKIEGNRPMTLALLDHKFEGHFTNDALHFSDFFGQAGHKGSKADVAIARGFTHTTDDQMKHAIDLAEVGMISFLLDRHWNQGQSHPLVIRADWAGIGEILQRHHEVLASVQPTDQERVLEELRLAALKEAA